MKRLFAFAFLIAATAASARGQDAALPKVNRGETVLTREKSEARFYQIYFNRTLEPAVLALPETMILDKARSKKLRRLSLLIDNINSQFSLTELQKKKLHVAGEHDIQKLFSLIAQLKNTYVSNLGDWAKLRVTDYADRLYLTHGIEADLFGSESIYSKVSRTILNEKQLGKLRASRDERNRVRWKTRALITAQAWGDGLGMNDGQRRRLADLIVAEIPPPSKPTSVQGDYSFIECRLSLLPRDQLQPIFDASQWKVFARQLDRVTPTVKQRLIQWGYDLGETNQAKPKQEPVK